MKKLFIILTIVVVALAGVITALVTLVNPNQFKPLIVEQVKQYTGLELSIQGDIHWQFFPTIGFQLGQTELKNPKGFSNRNMFKVEHVAIDISVLPLLDKQLIINDVILTGAQINLETLADGSKNIATLLNYHQADHSQDSSLPVQLNAAAQQKTMSAKEQTTQTKQPTIQADYDTSNSPTVSPRHDKWSIKLAGLTIENATLHIIDQQTEAFSQLSDVSLHLSGFVVQPSTRATFAADQKTEAEPDLSGLGTLDVKGNITIAAFEMHNTKMQNVKAKFSVKDAIVTLSSFNANLYSGTIIANGTLDARHSPASYTMTSKIAGVNVQPLLKDLLDNDKLTGIGSIELNLDGQGLTPQSIQNNLAGTMAINFTDGAVNGINISQLIRTNYAKLTGESVGHTEEAQKTDFSSMQATIKLANGVASTDDLSAKSPLLRVQAQGSTNYLKQTLDALIQTSIVGSLKGQGGQNINDLKGVTIPVKVTGSWSKPKYTVLLDKSMKQKAKAELEKGIDKLNQKLGGKINNDKAKKAVDQLINSLFK